MYFQLDIPKPQVDIDSKNISSLNSEIKSNIKDGLKINHGEKSTESKKE